MRHSRSWYGAFPVYEVKVYEICFDSGGNESL